MSRTPPTRNSPRVDAQSRPRRAHRYRIDFRQMDQMTQAAALHEVPLARGERAQFWREARFDGLECLSATFRTHSYAPHTHDTYVIGTIEAGCESFSIRNNRIYAGPGEICMVNPEEVHDGEPYGEGYSYRMTYPTVGLIRQIAADLIDRPVAATPFFRFSVVGDPELAMAFSRLHRLLEAGGDRLEQDEKTHQIYACLLSRYADFAPKPVRGRERRPIVKAKSYLADHFSDDIDLATLSGIAGLTRSHLVRAFKRETGLTPHAYLTDIRVRHARRLLAAGGSPAEVAVACGFYDQSHLNRLFKARSGVTPGAFRAVP